MVLVLSGKEWGIVLELSVDVSCLSLGLVIGEST